MHEINVVCNICTTLDAVALPTDPRTACTTEPRQHPKQKPATVCTRSMRGAPLAVRFDAALGALDALKKIDNIKRGDGHSGSFTEHAVLAARDKIFSDIWLKDP